MLDAKPKRAWDGLTDRSTRDFSFRERRAYPRYPFEADAEISGMGSDARLATRTPEVSLGGCFVETPYAFLPGTQIQLRILTEKRSFETPARVAYSHPGIGMGVAFMETGPGQRKVLEDWVNELRSSLEH